MRIVDGLIAEDLVRYQGSRGSTRGHPSALLAVNGKAYAVIGAVADLSGVVQQEMYLPR